ncbi:RING finger family 4 domain-containing protein [Nonomuraea sp. NPDC050556]|uniref:RING finger family 4 domain-containing protein n=1 Tax=Nonomuraea sp. NPDC050556 TaxID=3364369 RepID=UPI00379423A0
MNGPAEILLRKKGLVSPALFATGDCPPPPFMQLPRRMRLVVADVPSGVAALEFELLQVGYLVPAALHHALAALEMDELTRVGRRLLHALREQVGANAHHVPLFRKFPDSVPADTADFYVRRVFTLLLQDPSRPCVLCGEVGAVHAVRPCAHLVCRVCWDGADFSACPICHRRIDLDDPFLLPDDAVVDRDAVTRTTLMRLSADPVGDCRELAVGLMTRQTPMPQHDRSDLDALLEAFWPESAAWVPESIPVKETRANVLAFLLSRDPSADLSRLETATDVLRLLYVLMGADPGLRVPPARRRSLPRALRRSLLGALDRMALPYLVEDLQRYGEQWKRMGEVLHPGEYANRFPNVALAFAVLRGTPITSLMGARPLGDPSLAGKRPLEGGLAPTDDPSGVGGRPLGGRAAPTGDPSPAGAPLLVGERPLGLALPGGVPESLRVVGGRLRNVSFASQVEGALEAGEHVRAFELLTRRPGELARRLSQLLRLDPALLERDIGKPLRRVAPGVLLAALGQVRTPPGGMRLFLPRGGQAKAWPVPDERREIPPATVAEAARLVEDELLRRVSALPPLACALLDEGLADLVAPTSERSASASLVRLSRGSVQPLPDGDTLRLFLHWTEPPGTRVDLDLSVAVYDAAWRFVGLCDYTHLRLGDAVTHSGDLTSAPAPLGSTEFIDVDVSGLDGRYLVPVVFSYNDVPFDELVDGFAGFMADPRGHFDPRAVRQRMDLTGAAKVLLPLVADLRTRELCWADVNLGVRGYGHDVDANSDSMAAIGAALRSAYRDRVTAWEVASWHASRAGRIVVRGRDGALTSGGLPYTGDLSEVDFAVLVDWDVELPPAADVYALRPSGKVMADLLTELKADA